MQSKGIGLYWWLNQRSFGLDEVGKPVQRWPQPRKGGLQTRPR
jgi:hypothetical protein